MSADNSAVWGASAPATSAALWATVGLAFSTVGSYAAVRGGPRPAGWPLREFDALLPLWDNEPAVGSWGGCALGTTPGGGFVPRAQWQDRAAALPLAAQATAGSSHSGDGRTTGRTRGQ